MKSVSFIPSHSYSYYSQDYSKKYFSREYCLQWTVVVTGNLSKVNRYYRHFTDRYPGIFAKLKNEYDNNVVLEYCGVSLRELLDKNYKKESILNGSLLNQKYVKWWKEVLESVFIKLRFLERHNYFWDCISLNNIIVREDTKVRFINPNLTKGRLNAVRRANRKAMAELLQGYTWINKAIEEATHW